MTAVLDSGYETGTLVDLPDWKVKSDAAIGTGQSARIALLRAVEGGKYRVEMVLRYGRPARARQLPISNLPTSKELEHSCLEDGGWSSEVDVVQRLSGLAAKRRPSSSCSVRLWTDTPLDHRRS